MSEGKPIRVLVVDDHPVVCFGLSAMIDAQGDMTAIGQASNGREAVEAFERLLPDVTLMDLRMPQMGGVQAIRNIRSRFPTGGFIVLTTYYGDEDIHKALSAGAQGYILKGMHHEELLEAIRRVHAGLKYVPESVMQHLAKRNPASDLSARELQILGLIVKGLSNRQIAESLGITEGTVKWHVNIILGRLNVSDRTQAAVTALQRGIVET